MAADAAERLDLYAPIALRTAARVTAILGKQALDREIWSKMRSRYSSQVRDRDDVELAETFFNSVTRRVFSTVGVDPDIEFVKGCMGEAAGNPPTFVSHRCDRPLARVVRQILGESGIDAPFADLDGDATRVAERIEAVVGDDEPVTVDLAGTIFFRGMGAYLIGRIVTSSGIIPIAIALRHDPEGVGVDAVLMSENDASILFSFAHSYFHVALPRPRNTAAFVSELVPRKRMSELYISLGRTRHGKTLLFREMRAQVDEGEVFVEAPGKKGLVMAVFTLPGFEMVLKVIRDDFPPQKSITPSQVMEKYRLVFHHDRAGRLVDSQSFEHLEFPAESFEKQLLESLLSECSRSVHLEGGEVHIGLAYAQRRVTPLDVYLRTAPEDKARLAVVDYGNAIKDLAVTGIFPGDLLSKNFGVTRNERVVFYDYDELTEITECRFRDIPEPTTYEDAIAGKPWFPIGPDDIFPAEFGRFLGMPATLKEVFLGAHADLLRASWWRSIQGRIADGEIVPIYPYAAEERLHGAMDEGIGAPPK